MKQRQREEKKALLLHQIQQQRIDLSAERRNWLDVTARYDGYWLRVMHWRRYWVIGSGVIALYGVRHPNRLVRWARRGLGLFGTVNLLRKTMSSR